MTDLDQLAAEALKLRTDCINSAIGHLHIPIWDWTAPGVDHLAETRRLIAANWDRKYPELARLAAQAQLEPAGA